MDIFPIDPLDEITPFPDPEQALEEPNGLLAFGAQLTPERLLMAYRNGIFPWYSPGEPILWWSPDPRCVLWPEDIQISRSLRKVLKRGQFEIRHNTVFSEVIRACATPRADQNGTWITNSMHAAYCRMHELGYAHSIESWQGGQLVGGLYGIQLGSVFFGESMFSRVSNASKIALVDLATHHDLTLIDCQVGSEHLYSMGATDLSRPDFLSYLKQHC